MEIIKIDDNNVIEKAISTLQKGGLIIFPTETAYGVGVDATNSEAVSRLLNYKKRPEGKAISIGCASKEMSEEYVVINQSAENIYKEFLPGPVTVISKSKGKVDKRLESEKGTLGIRIPDHKLILEIITRFGKPITTTSANSAGKKTPYSVDDVFDTLSQKQKALIDLVIDGGELPKNLTSTVIDTTGSELQTFRQGAIDFNRSKKEPKVHNSKSVEETIQLAEDLMKSKIDQLSTSPVIFLLRGKLGAGKTHFTKGIARALGITQNVKSPTYTYVSEYRIQESGDRRREADFVTRNTERETLYHIDAWRIENRADLELLGFESWVKAGNVLVIEWPEIIMNLLGSEFFDNLKNVIVIEITGIGDSREIKIYT
jgi:L-threonylcarbamoyladenylate synthase